MHGCPHPKRRGIEAALQGPLGIADIETTGASLRSRGGMRPLRTRRHVLGAGNAPCRDKELRQWMPCVTFSASPRTVTHASRRGALAQSVSSAGGRTWQDRRSDAAAAQGGGSERKAGRQRPNDESRTTALIGRAALPGLKAAWVSATQTGTAARMPRAITRLQDLCARAGRFRPAGAKTVCAPSVLSDSVGALAQLRQRKPYTQDRAREKIDHASNPGSSLDASMQASLFDRRPSGDETIQVHRSQPFRSCCSTEPCDHSTQPPYESPVLQSRFL